MKKLSKRLQLIYDWIDDHKYSHIYDVCCDHGQLAMAITQTHKDSKVYAIDCAPLVIEKLKATIKPDSEVEVHLADGAHFPYKDDSLIVIAGVGAHTSIKIINHILTSKLKRVDIIVCCHQNMDILREYLIDQTSLGLKDELIIEDKNKLYELMLLSSTGESIGIIGSIMWKKSDEVVKRKYFDKMSKFWDINRSEKASAYRKKYQQLGQTWEL